MVSTVAGSTASGYVDGVGTVVMFNYPREISVDSTGNLWVADYWNHMVRRIDTAGRVHSYSCTSIYICIFIPVAVSFPTGLPT